MNTIEHQQSSVCPECKTELECSTDPRGDRTPQPGDFNVCLRCATILVYVTVEPLQVRRGTEEDVKKLNADELLELARVQTAIRVVMAERQRRS